MRRLMCLIALAMLPACAAFSTAQKVSGDENQVVLSSADQMKAQQHCAAYSKDAVNTGQNAAGQITYACRPRSRTGTGSM